MHRGDTADDSQSLTPLKSISLQVAPIANHGNQAFKWDEIIVGANHSNAVPSGF